jgi:hypothetical protein
MGSSIFDFKFKRGGALGVAFGAFVILIERTASYVFGIGRSKLNLAIWT